MNDASSLAKNATAEAMLEVLLGVAERWLTERPALATI